MSAITSRGGLQKCPPREVFSLKFIKFTRSILIEMSSIIYNQVDFVWTESK